MNQRFVAGSASIAGPATSSIMGTSKSCGGSLRRDFAISGK
jgi:hypothetical protein